MGEVTFERKGMPGRAGHWQGSTGTQVAGGGGRPRVKAA